MKRKTVLLLDYRKNNIKWFQQNVLEGVITGLTGIRYVQFFQRCTGSTLKERELEAKQIIKSMDNWNEKNKIESKNAVPVKTICDTMLMSSGPCTNWYKNMWQAFQDKNVEYIIYFPYDIMYFTPKSKPGDKRLQDFIDTVNSSNNNLDLLLGLYEALTVVEETKQKNLENNFLGQLTSIQEKTRKDIPKNFLEDFTILELWSLFPESMAWYFSRRTLTKYRPKPRTGFFAVSRRLFEEFKNRPFRPTMLPWAGTVQLLLTAIIKNRLENKEVYKIQEMFISKIHEPPIDFTDYRVAHQRERISYVLRDEHAYWSREFPSLRL